MDCKAPREKNGPSTLNLAQSRPKERKLKNRNVKNLSRLGSKKKARPSWKWGRRELKEHAWLAGAWKRKKGTIRQGGSLIQWQALVSVTGAGGRKDVGLPDSGLGE